MLEWLVKSTIPARLLRGEIESEEGVSIVLKIQARYVRKSNPKAYDADAEEGIEQSWPNPTSDGSIPTGFPPLTTILSDRDWPAQTDVRQAVGRLLLLRVVR